MAGSSETRYVLAADEGGGSGSVNPRRWMLLLVSIGVFLVQYIQSQALLAPFLAVSSVGAAVGPDVVGIIFCAYPLATALATPLPPRMLRVFGLRGMVCFGLVVTSAANLAFGFTGSAISSKWGSEWLQTLSVAMVVLRMCGGVGAAMAEAGCLTAVSSSGWGDDVGKALSSIEVTTGIGAAIGAALGGLLYDLGRFLLPMLVAACLPLCMVPFTARWLPDDSPSEDDERGEGIPPADEDEASGKRRRGLACRRDLQRGMTCVSLFFSATVFEGLNPLFEPHLKRAPYHFDIPDSGVLLAAICVLYTLTALPIGWLVDRGNRGLAEDDVQGRATMCALWNGIYSAGSAIGPLVSVMLYARCGWAFIVVAQAAISVGCALLLVAMSSLALPAAEEKVRPSS